MAEVNALGRIERQGMNRRRRVTGQNVTGFGEVGESQPIIQADRGDWERQPIAAQESPKLAQREGLGEGFEECKKFHTAPDISNV